MRYVVGFSVGGHSRWASSAASWGPSARVGEQAFRALSRTVTVEKSVPARQPNPTTTTPTHNVGSLGDARSAFERAWWATATEPG